MDLNKLSLISAMKKRLAWLTQRQEILAQNIANSDSPGYKPKDIEPLDFKHLLRREQAQINMNLTSPGHLVGSRRRVTDFTARKTRKPYETAPAGNAVILEEQMLKLTKTGVSYKLVTELYKKNLGMLRMAIGKKN